MYQNVQRMDDSVVWAHMMHIASACCNGNRRHVCRYTPGNYFIVLCMCLALACPRHTTLMCCDPRALAIYVTSTGDDMHALARKAYELSEIAVVH